MSTVNIGQDFVEHHGVKGMKWGKRKRRNESDRAKTFGNKGNGKQSPTKHLSDKELQQIVNRMNMEQNYARLTAPKKSNVVKNVLAAGATVNAAIAFSKSPAGRAVANSLSASGNRLIDTSRAVGTIGR